MNSLTHLAESCHKVSKPQPCYHGHYIELCSFVSLFLARQSSVGHGLLIHEVSTSHTTHHTQQDSSVRVISSSQRLLPDNTQQSQQTDIHALGGIRTHNLSRRAAVDLRLRPRGQWDRHKTSLVRHKQKKDLSRLYVLVCEVQKTLSTFLIPFHRRL